MRKLTNMDHVERLFMDCSDEEFLQLEERVTTIKRLRKLDRKPKAEKPGNGRIPSLDLGVPR